jgi:hypothetical protein
MSAFGDIMAGLKTVVELTGKVERLERNVDKLSGHVDGVDRRLVRLETIIEVTRNDGETLRIASPASEGPTDG